MKLTGHIDFFVISIEFYYVIFIAYDKCCANLLDSGVGEKDVFFAYNVHVFGPGPLIITIFSFSEEINFNSIFRNGVDLPHVKLGIIRNSNLEAHTQPCSIMGLQIIPGNSG